MKRKGFYLLVAVCAILPLFILVCCTGGKTLPCDIYAKYGTPCVTAHSTTRLLYSKYRGPLYQVQRDSDGATLSVMAKDGYADAVAQDEFLWGTVGRIIRIYDQSGKGNDLVPAAPGTFKGPDKGEFNTQSIADMAPVIVDGHKAYGVFIMPGMGYRCNNASYLAINDEPEGIYYVIDGTHFDSGCCFDYGNSSTNGKAVGTGTMETTYYGTSTAWGRGNGEGPWIMSDMEAGLFSGYDPKQNDVPAIDSWRFVSVYVNGGGGNQWDLRGADATSEEVVTYYSGVRPHTKEGSDAYFPMNKKGAMLLGNGGDNGNGSAGTFYEGVMTVGYPTDEAVAEVQKNIASAHYCEYPLSMTRLTTFAPGTFQEVTVAFVNNTGKDILDLSVSYDVPKGWAVMSPDDMREVVPTGVSRSFVFQVYAPETRSAGFLTFDATWTGGGFSTAQRVRSAEAVKINEVKLSAPADPQDQFVELFNASDEAVKLSGLELEVRRSGWAPVTAVVLPEDAVVEPGGFYTLSLSKAAAVAAVAKGSDELYLNAALQAGDALQIGGQSYCIAASGTPAGQLTTVFIPVSTGPYLHFSSGTTNLPLTSVAGFEPGQKMGIGLGGDYEVVEITAVGTPATQSVLSAEAKAGDTTLTVETTCNLLPGSLVTIDTGQRTEVVKVKTLVKSSDVPVRRFGPQGTPHEPGIIEIETPLKKDHMNGVDVSCPGEGVSFSPATQFAHESGDAVQPLGKAFKLDRPLSSDVDLYQGLVAGEYDNVFGYALSASAGSIALVDAATGAVVDAIVYGSQQSNSSGNGTIASPELATLEGVQNGGGCIAVVPPAPRPSFGRPGQPMSQPQVPQGPGKSLVRLPDGADADALCKDFSTSAEPTPGRANVPGSETR